MHPHREYLLVALILAAPMPAAAQVSVDLNALNALGGSHLPAPPPAAPRHAHHGHPVYRHLARTRHARHQAPPTAVATAAPHAGPGAEAIQHPKNLGSSFTSLPPLPGAAPPPPALPPPIVVVKAAPPKAVVKAPPPAAVVKAPAPATVVEAPPQLPLPVAAPPPPTRLAETTPAPPAAAPPAPPSALPKGADSLTLPFSPQQSDLPPAESAILRNFAQRYGPGTRYVIRAFASAPPGDDDPSTPRRMSLDRAQSVAAALAASGVKSQSLRLLALGATGGKTADRVEVIAMPATSRHTDSDSSP